MTGEVPGRQDIVEQDITVGGLRLHTARRSGASSPPLLLIHGLGGDLVSWRPLLDRLPGRDAIMIDAPGAGRSEVPMLPLTIAAVADLMVEVVEMLGVDQVDVLGYSLGGLVTQELVRRYPHVVRKAILASTMGGIDARAGTLRARLTLLTSGHNRSREGARRSLPVLAGGRTARDAEALAAVLAARHFNPPSGRGYYFQQMGAMAWLLTNWSRGLPVPTLVLQGSEDPVVPEANGRKLAARSSNARLEVVKGAGHMLLFDEPDTVPPIIADFLNS